MELNIKPTQVIPTKKAKNKTKPGVKSGVKRESINRLKKLL